MKDFGVKKLYYSISEVSKLTDLEQYILRYWETEFEQLKPSKNRAGNRIYTNRDIQLILKIKKLLRDQKYTIDGAKKNLVDIDVEKEEEVTAEICEVELKNDTEKYVNSKDPLKKELEEIRLFLLDLKSKF